MISHRDSDIHFPADWSPTTTTRGKCSAATKALDIRSRSCKDARANTGHT